MANLTDADKVLRNDTGKDIVEKLDDIAQALGVGVDADQINYNNTTSGLEATDVQDAIDEVNTKVGTKANTSDVYNKTETYTKTEVDNIASTKADKSTTYTKTEVDNALDLKADKSDTYTKEEVDDKVDVSDTASGAVASFDDGSGLPFQEIKCEINAIQEGTPWIDSNVIEKEPYNFRKVAGTASRIGNHLFDKLVGGTVVFNQLVQFATGSGDNNGVTFTRNADGTITTSGTATGLAYLNPSTEYNFVNHKILFCGCASGGDGWTYYVKNGYANEPIDTGNGAIANVNGNFVYQIIINTGVDTTGLKFTPQAYDLTAMFGSTIADYIYSLEQATAGAGVAWFRKLFSASYYPYNAGQLLSVKAIQHNTIGFNQWNEQTRNGYYNTNGTFTADSNYLASKDFIQVFPNTEYHFESAGGKFGRVCWYDENQSFISTAVPQSASINITSPANACYLQFDMQGAYGSTYKHDICINISDANKNGTYEPYSKHEYPLDGSRKVHRVFGIVDLGTLTWTKQEFYGSKYGFLAYLTGIKPASSPVAKGNILCDTYITRIGNDVYLGYDGISMWSTEDRISIYDSTKESLTEAQFKTAMSGKYLVYELETPFDETVNNPELRGVLKLDSNNKLYYYGDTCSDFTNPMLVDGNGTEEFVDGRTVEMPVGHESYYANICPIVGHSELNLTRCGVNLWDEEWEYINSRVTSKNYIKVAPNTEYFFCNNKLYDVEMFDKSKNSLGNPSYTPLTEGFLFTTAINCEFIKFSVANSYGSTYKNDISINYPSTDTEYHAYSGQTFTVAFGQTVYGGVYDKSGRLTITHGFITYDGSNDEDWGFIDAVHRAYISVSDIDISTPDTDIADVKANIYASGAYSGNGNRITGRYNIAQINVFDSSVNNITEWRALLSNTPLTVAYELATPIEIDVSAISVETLLGENRVSHNCNGDIEVKYIRQTDLLDSIEFVHTQLSPVLLSATLTAGSSSITISDSHIKADSLLDIWTDPTIYYTDIIVTNGSVTINTFPTMPTDTLVKVRVN